MNTESIDLIELFIPSIGKCTLFPSIDDLRDALNTYKALCEVAKHLGLGEIPTRSHEKTQEIFRILALTFSEVEEDEVRVLISGVHESYSSINTTKESIIRVTCVTAMDLYIYGKTLFNHKNPFTHHIEMTLDEVPITEEQKGEKPFYCLFLSAS